MPTGNIVNGMGGNLVPRYFLLSGWTTHNRVPVCLFVLVNPLLLGIHIAPILNIVGNTHG